MAKESKNKSDFPELYTIQEACDILRCHPNTLRQWDFDGTLAAIRIGKKKVRRYKKEDLLNFINQNENGK